MCKFRKVLCRYNQNFRVVRPQANKKIPDESDKYKYSTVIIIATVQKKNIRYKLHAIQ